MNIIDAIIHLVDNPRIRLYTHYISNNRANSMGEALEEYVKDLFADSFNNTGYDRLKKHEACFSYLGNQNNPPDAMLWNGDAIEVKKLEGDGSIALNSSYPKQTLKVTNKRINRNCINAESWTEKDMIYVVGTAANNSLKYLCMVYGMDYCASEECYQRLEDSIRFGITQVEDVAFAPTNEIAHVNRVDPLGITYMRVRGMWGIQNPWKVFDYVYERPTNNDFVFMCIINERKWRTFNNTNELEKRVGRIRGLSINDTLVRNPDNPAQLRRAKLITFVQ